jgi:hypothetical protein
MNKENFLEKYYKWCLENQASEGSNDYRTLRWVEGSDVESIFDFCTLEQINPAELFPTLLIRRVLRKYEIELSPRGSGRPTDCGDFEALRLRHHNEKFTNLKFSYTMMLRSRNRKRDRRVAREIQQTLGFYKWEKYRHAPSELGTSLRIGQKTQLDLHFSLPSGSLQFEYKLQRNEDVWLWGESYVSWFGLGGATQVWGSTENETGLADFIVEQTRKFEAFLRSCLDEDES